MNEWVELCLRVMSYLRPESFQTWMFIVGTTGTDLERTARGNEALRLMDRRHYINYGIVSTPNDPIEITTLKKTHDGRIST